MYFGAKSNLERANWKDNIRKGKKIAVLNGKLLYKLFTPKKCMF